MSPAWKASAEDLAWLRRVEMDLDPAPVVAAGRYQEVVDARDAAVRKILLMRTNRRRMGARYRRLRKRLFWTEWAAAAAIGVLIVWKW